MVTVGGEGAFPTDCNQPQYIKWFRSSKEFIDLGVFVDVKSRLDPSSRAISLFKTGALQKTPIRVKASAWFTPGLYRHDAAIQEQSWAMLDYNAVQTLLWGNDDIDGEDWYE